MDNTFSYTNSRGRTYYLHGKMQLLRNGIERPLYYFRKAVDAVYALSAVPEGYEVMEAKSGMPVLRKAA